MKKQQQQPARLLDLQAWNLFFFSFDVADSHPGNEEQEFASLEPSVIFFDVMLPKQLTTVQ